MYQVIGTARSRSIRVFWMLEELGQEYEILAHGPHSNEIKAVNPSGKVPALIVDGTTMLDSVAIMQFLADRHENLTYKAGTIQRGIQDSFTHFALDEIDGPLWTAGKHSFVLPEKLRVPAVKETAKAEFKRAMKTLETRLGDNEFVMGDKITVPDILIGHCAGWAKNIKYDLPEGKLGDYFDRVRSRPALKRALVKSA